MKFYLSCSLIFIRGRAESLRTLGLKPPQPLLSVPDGTLGAAYERSEIGRLPRGLRVLECLGPPGNAALLIFDQSPPFANLSIYHCRSITFQKAQVGIQLQPRPARKQHTEFWHAQPSACRSGSLFFEGEVWAFPDRERSPKNSMGLCGKPQGLRIFAPRLHFR